MKHLLAQLADGQPLSQAQATEAFELIMTGQATEPQTAALLAMIQQRGPTVDEIVGAAAVMRAKVVPVEVPDELTVIDTCGTGGWHSDVFNVSTTAAIVAAAVGRPRGVAVAKHGNRSVTSKSGSSNVLETLGVKIRVSAETLTTCLQDVGLCFCFAAAHHPAMKYAAPVRAQLGFRTIFNIVGPLTNPAGAKRQVMGVFASSATDLLAKVLVKLGSEHAIVAHGQIPDRDGKHVDGLGELSTCGPTRISEVRDGRVRSYEISPDEIGLPFSHPSALRVDGPEASAKVVRDVLSGKTSPARDIVCLNAAAALVVAELTKDLSEGVDMAGEAIDSGAAQRVLDDLVKVTSADPTPVG